MQIAILFTIIYLLMQAFGYWLELLNISHMRRFSNRLPSEFEGKVDIDFLTKAQSYTIENTKFGIVASIFESVILLLFLFGIMEEYNGWITSLGLPFIASGLIFFILLSYADTILGIPFSLYHAFRIEKKYGFNTMTPRLWAADFIKSIFVSTVLFAVMVSAGLWIIQKSPGLWWLWIWCFFLAFSIFMMYLSPYVIEPLFNKFEPVEDEALKEGIGRIAEKAGIKVKKILKIDASKRTRHTNAYFTGIGHVKRIVLYDTLMEQLDKNEIISVLAHEIGHWKKKHILKFIVATELIALAALFISHRLVQGELLNNLFGIDGGSFFTKAVVLGFLGSIVSFPIGPIFMYFSRRHEIEADRYSKDLAQDPQAMVSSLVKLSKDNLSNLHPHPLYVKFHYSHPPVLERIRRIKGEGHST